MITGHDEVVAEREMRARCQLWRRILLSNRSIPFDLSLTEYVCITTYLQFSNHFRCLNKSAFEFSFSAIIHNEIIISKNKTRHRNGNFWFLRERIENRVRLAIRRTIRAIVLTRIWITHDISKFVHERNDVEIQYEHSVVKGESKRNILQSNTNCDTTYLEAFGKARHDGANARISRTVVLQIRVVRRGSERVCRKQARSNTTSTGIVERRFECSHELFRERDDTYQMIREQLAKLLFRYFNRTLLHHHLKQTSSIAHISANTHRVTIVLFYLHFVPKRWQ